MSAGEVLYTPLFEEVRNIKNAYLAHTLGACVERHARITRVPYRMRIDAEQVVGSLFVRSRPYANKFNVLVCFKIDKTDGRCPLIVDKVRVRVEKVIRVGKDEALA